MTNLIPLNKPSRLIQWTVWGGLGLVIIGIFLAFAVSRIKPATVPMPVLGQLPDFHLTNQLNEPITLASLKGQVWVADVIFTRCPSICIKMTRQMAQLQSTLPAGLPVRLVSLTTDPDFDTPNILKRYGSNVGANPDRWWFLTGMEQDLINLEAKGFKFSVMGKAPADREVPDDRIIHSTFFMLVDQQGRVRGWTDQQGQTHFYFDTEDPDSQKRMLGAISQLLSESAKP